MYRDLTKGSIIRGLLAGPVGEVGIWAAIPIGWALADVTGYGYYLLRRARLLPEE